MLRGIGATVALPMLDAMVPALANTPQKPLVKLGFVYFPHGAIMSQFTPSTEGKSFELGPILAPLEAFKRQITIVSGLENKHASGPTHAITPGTWLSSVSPRISHDPFGATTADQIAAQHIGQDTVRRAASFGATAGGRRAPSSCATSAGPSSSNSSSRRHESSSQASM